MPIAGMTTDELAKACDKLWDLLTAGDNDDKARQRLKLTITDYNLLKRKMMEREVERLGSRTAEEIYIGYVIDQIHNIRDLTNMIDKFKESKQYNAMVGAVKARAELNDKLMKMGQDLGVIAKEPTRHEVVGGIVVSDLTSRQLKAMITAELASLNEMMKRYGKGGGDIIDLKPGPTHLPTPKTKALGDGGKRMRVHKGRRVNREKVKVKTT